MAFMQRLKRLAVTATVSLGVLVATGCGDKPVNDAQVRLRTLRDMPEPKVERLRSARIFFGHQSVGGNIMAGVSDLVRAEPNLGLRVVPMTEASSTPAFFAHAKIGENGRPTFKTDEFARMMDAELKGRVDVAFHKYCYVDISASTDVSKLFEHYKQTMARLSASHPGVKFVHVTTPLVEVQGGWRATVKKLIGREPDHYTDNMARERFNALLRREYAGQAPVFDLAAFESTRRDGSRETFEYKAAISFSLVPEYASDGAHLNDEGRRIVAEQLLALLADVTSG
jgi:hypothetical protein